MKLYSIIVSIVLLFSSLTGGPHQVVPLSYDATKQSPSTSNVLLPVRGLYVQFERRGWPSGYWSGDAIQSFNTFDDLVGHTVAEELSLQLDQMQQMGVNTIAFELHSSDPTYIPGPFEPPTCNISPAFGLQYPQPTTLELNNLVSFLDLLHGKGMKVQLRLVNTHMEEQPPTNNTLWLGSILYAIQAHPALDLVLFEGNAHLIDTNGDGDKDSCGIPAEPPLWEGPTSVAANYVRWAIGYAHSLGLPYHSLSAEAIIGDYFTMMQPPNAFATDGHLWNPITVLKGIFDDLGVPNDQRTYAVSFYEHRKCATARGLPCVDTNPHTWAIATITNVFDTIGRGNGARVVAVEMGLLNPVEPGWNSEMAMESLVWVMQNYGVDGGCLWRWTSFGNEEELDPTLASPVKQRGTAFTYNPVKNFLQRLYTVGQTDDLNLTPDGIPPVFNSFSTLPVVVKNGDSVELSAGLGETHLFVTADLSNLDSSKTSPLVLMDQGNGSYKATTSILIWNESTNGIKSIQLTAMDFWGNPASTTKQVELQNPAPLLDAVPPDDSFNGQVLNLNKWQPDTASGAVVRQDGWLIISTSNTEAYSAGDVAATWTFPGDFDVQVDFQLGEGWGSPADSHLDGAFLSVNIAGEAYRITRLRSGNEDKLFAWSSTGVLVGGMPTTALSGKYRLIRTGTMLYLLYDIGNGWQKLSNATLPAGPAQVMLGNGSIFASQAFTTYFDNFQINSGLTTYAPKIYLPLIHR